jgi:hypothetical protein
MDGWYPEAKQLFLTTGEFSARNMPILAVVDHVSAGKDSRHHGQHVNNQSSFHFLIRLEGGVAVIYQFMSVLVAAWANGRYSNNNQVSSLHS